MIESGDGDDHRRGVDLFTIGEDHARPLADGFDPHRNGDRW